MIKLSRWKKSKTFKIDTKKYSEKQWKKNSKTYEIDTKKYQRNYLKKTPIHKMESGFLLIFHYGHIYNFMLLLAYFLIFMVVAPWVRHRTPPIDLLELSVGAVVIPFLVVAAWM